MPKVNHRRGFRGDDKYSRHMRTVKTVDAQGEPVEYQTGLNNGFGPSSKRPWRYIDKSMHGASDISLLADRVFGASIGNDFSNGNRGMAKAMRGAKKFVRTRLRFHENAATKRLAREVVDDLDD